MPIPSDISTVSDASSSRKNGVVPMRSMWLRTSSSETGRVRAISTMSPHVSPLHFAPSHASASKTTCAGQPMLSSTDPRTGMRGSMVSSTNAVAAFRTRNTRSPFPTRCSTATLTVPLPETFALESVAAKCPLFVQNSSTSPSLSPISGFTSAKPSSARATRPAKTPRLFGRP